MIEIYLLENTANGKLYVGQTRNENYGNGIAIQNAKHKYGLRAFSKMTLTKAEYKNTADFLESFFIACAKATGKSYNIANGGRGGHIHTPEMIVKLTASLRKGYEEHPERREKISRAMKGRPSPNKGKIASIETKTKLSKAAAGKRHTEEHKAHMREIMLNRTFSTETRIRMSKAAVARANTPEGRAQLLANNENRRKRETL